MGKVHACQTKLARQTPVPLWRPKNVKQIPRYIALILVLRCLPFVLTLSFTDLAMGNKPNIPSVKLEPCSVAMNFTSLGARSVVNSYTHEDMATHNRLGSIDLPNRL